MSVIIFFAVLAVLILSHEFGHFIVAKKSGIRVDEFGFGFPPRLFKFKKGETLYSFNLFPFGGFVKIQGEEGENSGDPRSFSSKPISVRAGVIAAGVVFNLILSWFLLSGGFMVGMPASVGSAPAGAEVKNARIMILQVQKDTPAKKAGLEAGDQILGFNVTGLGYIKAENIRDVQKFIFENKGKEINIKYKKNGETLSTSAIPSINPGEGKGSLGIAMDEIGTVNLPFYRAFWEGLKMTYNITIAVGVSIFYFISNAARGLAGFGQIMGPVGIVGVTGAAAKLGFGYLLGFIAMLSINLAIINILPFPALDGGRLLFLLAEKIKGSPVNYKFSNMVHTIGLIILIMLMLAITYKDIMRLV